MTKEKRTKGVYIKERQRARTYFLMVSAMPRLFVWRGALTIMKQGLSLLDAVS